MSTHYPKKRSRVKRAHKFGFRARMSTTNGRKTINRKRRVGRSVNVREQQ
ncbi:MAG: 50S ribosomal protein L34 [Phycisphaeraceae bacterium]|nr:50S ribosomal protein L34 [Phycisphaeraceae bacterium]